MDSPVWLISGCSTGIGREIARAALEAGDRVAVTARRIDAVEDLVTRAPDRARAFALDVTDPEQIRAVVEGATDAFGRIDVLVNNAGYGYVSSVEEGEDAEVRRMFDTNFFGALDLTKAVLPGMRARRAGFVMNLSSTTGLVSNPANVYYSASKFALESLSEGLAKEVAPFGIRVSVIEPGVFKTDWGSRSMKESPETIDDYAATLGERRKLLRSGIEGYGGEARAVGLALVLLSRLEAPPLRLLLGPDVLGAAREKLASMSAEFDAWAAVAEIAGRSDDGRLREVFASAARERGGGDAD